MIATFRITTDTIIRTLTHITATIHHITPTIRTTETMDIDIGILIGMGGGIIANPPLATTRTATFTMARDAHEVIEAQNHSVRHLIDRSGKWIANQAELHQKRIIQDVEIREDIKGGTKYRYEKIKLPYTKTRRLENNPRAVCNSVHYNISSHAS